MAVIGTTPIGSVQSEPHIWKFFDHDADADRESAHQRNLATRRNPATITTGRDFADQYIAEGALYGYDPTFDASPLREGLDPDWQVLNHVYGTLYDDYELAPLDVPVFLGLGRFDYTAPYHLWDDEQRHRLPRLDYVLYDKSGHTPPYEEPQRFTADIAAWATSL